MIGRACCYEKFRMLLSATWACCNILMLSVLYCGSCFELCGYLAMDNVTEIRVEYDYYTRSRVTPIFVANDVLLALKYEGFSEFVLNEVPHLRKMSSECAPLRMTLIEDNGSEVDISKKYFSSQMLSLLNKGTQMISVRIVAAESPVCVSKTSRKVNLKKDELHNTDLTSRTKLSVNNKVETCNNIVTGNSITINSSPESSAHSDQESPRLVLPLERYARKQETVVRDYTNELESKTKKLAAMDLKLEKASDQNKGHLNVCGNCHLKLGHTRKACGFSPCKSAFSCGFITKHSDQKSKRASLVKSISHLQSKLAAANRDAESARTAVEKVSNSSQKKIEDIILQEHPQRYIMNGARNWLQLNKDVALLQSKLRGKLPTRDTVMSLLRSAVISENASRKGESSSTIVKPHSTALGDTDRRMLPQKRVLEEEYNIVFPHKKSSCEKSLAISVPDLANEEQIDDFKLALKLQQEEFECPQSSEDESSLHSDSDAENKAASALLSLKNKSKQ